MNETLDRPRIHTNQLEVVLSGGELTSHRGMNCEHAGRFLMNLGRLYSYFCETVSFRDAYPEVGQIAPETLQENDDFLLPGSELSLVSARTGSMAFLLEAALTVQASLVGPLPTAIANFMSLLDALKHIQSLLPGPLKRWDRRLADKDERELAAIATVIAEVVRVAHSVDTITLTTGGGHTVVLQGTAFERLSGSIAAVPSSR